MTTTRPDIDRGKPFTLIVQIGKRTRTFKVPRNAVGVTVRMVGPADDLAAINRAAHLRADADEGLGRLLDEAEAALAVKTAATPTAPGCSAAQSHAHAAASDSCPDGLTHNRA